MEGTITPTAPFTLRVWPTLAGNCMVVFLQTSGAGASPVVTDDKGNTWATAIGPVAGNQNLWCLVATNVAAGTNLLTFTMATYDNFVSIDYFELFNVSQAAVASALDGTTSATTQTGGTVAAGSFSPTAGSIILHYASSTSGAQNTGFTKGSGFTLLSANLMSGAALVTTAVQSRIAPGGAVNPTITLTGGSPSADTIAIALKAATAGTAPPAGIRVAGIQKSSFGAPTGPTGIITLPFQFPHVGNLMAMTSTHDHAIASLNDGDGNLWDISKSYNPGGQLITATSFAKGVTPNSDMTGPTITWTGAMGGVNLGFITIYDIVGADPTNPFTNQYATNTGNQTVAGNLDILTGLTPGTAGNIFVIDALITSWTVQSLVAPSAANGGGGVLFDIPNAGGGGTTAEDDDFHGFWKAPSTSPVTVTLGIQNNVGGVGIWTASAMEFQAPAAGGQPDTVGSQIVRFKRQAWR